MTPEMNWSNIELDHVKPNCKFDKSNNIDFGGAFCWKFTQTLLKEVHQQKGKKFILLDYQLQFIKAYEILRLDKERQNESCYW